MFNIVSRVKSVRPLAGSSPLCLPTSLSQSLFQSICSFTHLFDLRLLVPREVNGFLIPLSHSSIALLVSFVLYFSLIVGLVSLLAAAFASFFHFGYSCFGKANGSWETWTLIALRRKGRLRR
jgi:hypothetical protein